MIQKKLSTQFGNNSSSGFAQDTSQDFSWKPVITISENAQKQAEYLCKKIVNDEWVGATIFSFKGDWQNETLEILVHDIYPLHHAHGMSFTADFNLDFSYVLNKGYDLTQVRYGLIHSHCNSSVFFSEPDMKELRENSSVYPFYLSLITNNRGDWTGKVCIQNEKEITEKGFQKLKTAMGDFIKKSYSRAYTIPVHTIFDCEIVTNSVILDDALFTDQVEAIIKQKRELDSKTKFYIGHAAYQDQGSLTLWNKSEEYSLEDVILEFFDGVDHDWTQLLTFGEYEPSEYSPELLVSYIKKNYKKFTYYSDKFIVNTAIETFKDFDTKFTKQLRKDYEKYTK